MNLNPGLPDSSTTTTRRYTSSIRRGSNISQADELDNMASRDQVHTLNVDYIDRRSGSLIADKCPHNQSDNENQGVDSNLQKEESSAKKSDDDATYDPKGKKLHRQASYTPHMEEKLQRKLKFFFMNPMEKWKAKSRFPWKLSIQVIKLFIVTLQLVIFAQYIDLHVTRQEDTKTSLRHLFLSDWQSTRDLKVYPPAEGLYAVFTKNEFYNRINHAITQFAKLEDISIAPFSYDNPFGRMTDLKFCKNYYRIGKVWSFNNSFLFDSTDVLDCLTIPSKIITDTFSTEIFLKNNNFSISFSRLKSAHLKFSIKSVFLKSLKPWDLPDCYKFKISINFDNSNHDGLIAINMDIDFVRLVCHGNIQYADKNIEQNVIDDVLVAAVIIMCMTSMILCSRALYRAQTLRVETVLFFKRQYNKNLPWKDKMEFLNLWYITIIINDVLIISGSILKLIIAHTDALTSSHNDLYILCTISLGVGNLLMWCGVLRYFGFFPKYNILILTLKKALPDVLRYLLCVVFIFMGFAICGWLVLGPYHYKFRTLLRTFQCLFALVNGDDMFATFQMVSKDAKVVIDWFCMIYLYSFVSLFIYIVLSLFIAVIMEAYELIKEYYEHGFPKSLLMEFIAQCNEEASSSLFRHDAITSSKERWTSCINCLKCKCVSLDDDSNEFAIGNSDY